jgi:hypothetical protein
MDETLYLVRPRKVLFGVAFGGPNALRSIPELDSSLRGLVWPLHTSSLTPLGVFC